MHAKRLDIYDKFYLFTHSLNQLWKPSSFELGKKKDFIIEADASPEQFKVSFGLNSSQYMVFIV